MIITKDTQEMTDPNEFGETLRNYCFINDAYADKFFGGRQYGCYSTFALRQEFYSLMPNEPLYQKLRRLSGIDDTDLRANFYAFCCSDGIFLGWWWDGDGILIIGEGNKIAINDDCKCDYTWEWCNDEAM